MTSAYVPDEIINGEAASDESTDGEDDALVGKCIGRMVRRPCRWVQFAHKLLCGELMVCFRPKPICDIPSAWKCHRRKVAMAFLEKPATMHIRQMIARDDFKIFARIQAAPFLHAIDPNEPSIHFVLNKDRD